MSEATIAELLQAGAPDANELGVVIGRRARDVAEAEADRFIFGYTCVNDVTALDVITGDPFEDLRRRRRRHRRAPGGEARGLG